MFKATTVQKMYVLCAQEPKPISLSVYEFLVFFVNFQLLYYEMFKCLCFGTFKILPKIFKIMVFPHILGTLKKIIHLFLEKTYDSSSVKIKLFRDISIQHINWIHYWISKLISFGLIKQPYFISIICILLNYFTINLRDIKVKGFRYMPI